MREFNEIVISKMEDLSGLAIDQSMFKNPSYYRDSYNIPPEETLLVFAEGTFITDEAIYINPSKTPIYGDSRIPLSDICSFLIYENKNSEVKLFGEKTEYQIFASKSRQTKGTAGRLVNLLKELQDNLLKTPENKRSYEKVCKRIYTFIRKEFREAGVLSEDLLSIISVMEELPIFRREAVFLALENEYRKGNRASYDRLLNEKSRLLTPENFEILKRPDDIFYVSYISDLKDIKGYSNVKAIIDSYLRFKATPRFSLREASILCHLCVRMEDYDYLSAILSEAGDDFSEEELWGLMGFIAESKNAKVFHVLTKLFGHAQVTKEELLRGNDLGLTSLHFALMFRNKELVRRLLPLCDWKEYRSQFSKDRMVDLMFDFLFLGSLVSKDDEFLKEIFIYTSPQACSLNRSINQVQKRIEINEALIRKYPEHTVEYGDKIEEYKSMKAEMEEELELLSRNEVYRKRQMAKIVAEADHPLCNYLFWLYSSTENLLSWIRNTAENHRLCRYKQCFFLTKPGIDLGLSFYEWKDEKVAFKSVNAGDYNYTGGAEKPFVSWENARIPLYENPVFKEQKEAERRRAAAEKERRRREFRERVKSSPKNGGSWFSEKARTDLRVLKEEYRVLVKKYHPDSSGDTKTAKIFMRIMAERADILEGITEKP